MITAIFSFLFLLNPAFAEIQLFELKGSEALTQAVASSQRLRSMQLDLEASEKQSNSAHSSLFPKLSLEGYYRYQTNVQTINLPIPNSIPIQFGDHNNYSVGPTLSYTLLDGGRLGQIYQGQLKLKESKEQDQKATRLDLESAVLGTYVHTQLNLEQIKTVAASLELSESQGREVSSRFKAGSSSELDLLTARQDVLNYKLKYKQTQSELAASLRDLISLTGNTLIRDPSRPTPRGNPNSTVWLELDSLDDSIKAQEKDPIAEPDQNQPKIQGQSFKADALELAAGAQRAAAYPTLVLTAQATYGYPNGPLLQNVNQNSFSANFSMPIWEFGRTQLLAAQKQAEAESARAAKDQFMIDILRDFRKAKDLISSLREQEQITLSSVETAQRSAQLYYQSYKAGHLNLIDVQAANNRALQTKFNLAQIRAAILSQLISMHAIAGKDFLE
ncbi:MAG: TolC family protein [Bdellovibrionia bacterium]